MISDDLKALHDRVKAVLSDRSLAPKLLPTSPGFFFGSLEYDDWYFGQLEYFDRELDALMTAWRLGLHAIPSVMVVKGQTKHGIVYTDGSAMAPNGNVYSREQMKAFIQEYRGVNRIHKPLTSYSSTLR